MKFAPTTLCSAVVLALSTSPLYASEKLPSSESNTDETMVVRAQSFDDYKVDSSTGAMRTDTTMLETPQSVSVIPEIVLDEQLATTLGEALQNDASVTAGSKKWNRETFSIRGFELSSTNGYMRNGHSLFTHYMLPIETLDRIEIIKGPSSLLYGNSAPGGMVNMVSKKPTATPRVNVGADFDDLGSTRYHIDASGKLNESGTLRGRTVLVKQDSVESRKYATGDNRERDRFLGYGIIEADLSDWGLLSLNYEKTQDNAPIDSGSWLDLNGNRIGDKDTIRDAHWSFINNDVENYGVDLTLYLSSQWEAKLSYNAQDMKRHRYDSMPYPSDDTLSDGSYTMSPFDRYDNWKTQAFHADLHGNFTALSVDHKLLLGTNGQFYDYSQQRVRGSSIVVQPGENPDNPGLDYNNATSTYESKNNFYGIYAQDLITLNDQWQALIGGRYDWYYADGQNPSGATVSGANDSQSFSPKAGLIFHPSYNGSIYANYSESFNPVSNVVNDDNSITERTPENSRQYELGTKWELMDNRLLLTGAVFDIEKKNISITENGITTQNGIQHHQGAEAGAQGQISDKWFVMASGMYLDANFDKHDQYQDKRPANVPEWSGSAWTRYAMTEATALNLGLFYQGERWADNANTLKLDGYARFDAGASHKIKSDYVVWDFRFNIENLFDKEYIAGTGGGGEYSSTGVINDVHYGDERRFKLSVNATF
ncbi:TonB-dependent receptor [Vibrio sp. 10N.286.49.C2]|uniref:TonB-dependent siderophore receptor n=1 Tax=unclassified Vibrio TaxID=2614977 RepID=UPI000C82A5C2|nr:MULTISPECIES: TonB-dependent receptor [unclassified Vibrio]PMH29477.1 TonB-dependent receptor [Vibrio sp. 10N.286.49.C2]PMH55992.1 TonB-dependent receptor [Vibrio sp. 10N.286.49.B1]PMH77752.1 TonB-dependent receptor [Vibrio sp. 10N.286.48.B7]